jgi:hypothetical protein
MVMPLTLFGEEYTLKLKAAFTAAVFPIATAIMAIV